MWSFLHLQKQILLTIQVSYLCTGWSTPLREQPKGVSKKARVTTWDVTEHTKAEQQCLSVGLCAAAAAQGESAGLFEIPPWRAADEIGQTLHSEASRSSAEHFVAHQSIEAKRSHVSPMQRLAGEFLEPHRERVTKCTGSTHRQIPTITVITTGQTPISFLYQTYKLNSVTLATADISGNQNFKGRTKINIWVFCQTQSTELL